MNTDVLKEEVFVALPITPERMRLLISGIKEESTLCEHTSSCQEKRGDCPNSSTKLVLAILFMVSRGIHISDANTLLREMVQKEVLWMCNRERVHVLTNE